MQAYYILGVLEREGRISREGLKLVPRAGPDAELLQRLNLKRRIETLATILSAPSGILNTL